MPPKASFDLDSTILQTLFQDMSSRAGLGDQFSESQNSVKFRTICSKCNSSLLGKKYDPVLRQLVRSIVLMAKSKLITPKKVQFTTKPHSLARAVCGHLLAAKGDVQNTEYDKQMREYFLSNDINTSLGLNIFYWYYPYESIIVVRDILMPAIRGRLNGPYAGFSILKFFPLGFLVSDADTYEDLNKIPLAQKGKEKDEFEITIDFGNIHDRRWPEKVDRGNFYVGGKTIESSIVAYKKR